MKVKKILGKMQKDKNGKYTCVEGESSRFSHAFMNSDVVEVNNALIEDYTGEERETMIATVNDIVEFSHYKMDDKECKLTEEHATLVINPIVKGAVYEINRQVEVTSETAWNAEIMPVAD